MIIYYHPGLNHLCILDATAQLNYSRLAFGFTCMQACLPMHNLACAANDFHWCFWADLGLRIGMFKCLGSSKSKMFQAFTAGPYLTCTTLRPQKIPVFVPSDSCLISQLKLARNLHCCCSVKTYSRSRFFWIIGHQYKWKYLTNLALFICLFIHPSVRSAKSKRNG